MFQPTDNLAPGPSLHEMFLPHEIFRRRPGGGGGNAGGRRPAVQERTVILHGCRGSHASVTATVGTLDPKVLRADSAHLQQPPGCKTSAWVPSQSNFPQDTQELNGDSLNYESNCVGVESIL